MIRRTTTAEFFLRLIIPIILMGLSFGLDFLPAVSDELVSFFRWLGIGILALILLIQTLQWIFDFVADNFHKTEVRENGTKK